jgi:nucleotide-binding universal stress UspA family protein
MIKYGKILVATDFSEQSTDTLRRAVVLARQFGAEIHLLHVLEPTLIYGAEMLSLSPEQEITEAKRDGAKKRLEKQAQDAGFDVHTHLEESMIRPSQAICEFAETLPADLIVIGRYGHRGRFEHLLIGSNAERVVRHAPCTVLVTKPHGILVDEEDG